MFENPRRGRQARKFTTNVPKILDLKSSSEQIFSENWRWVPLLNFAVCPGAWLMPGRMVINTESVVGYNNKLKTAGAGIKLGLNNDVNTDTKKAALRNMDGGPSKVNPPNSHPSNPIHKAATAESKKEPEPAVKTSAPKEPTQTVQTEEPVPTAGSGSESHDVNKIIVAVGAVAVAGLAFWGLR